jgi:lysophospholipase L1-like esterase
MAANPETYLHDEVIALSKIWPENRTVNIVCQGHSQPCGYTSAHMVLPFDAYPHQLHQLLQKRFPTAVINIITAAIGGENALSGAERFAGDALCHKPSVVIIDYGGNDLFQPISAIEGAWRRMAEKALSAGVKVILITPAPDSGVLYYPPENKKFTHEEHAAMLRRLADEYGVALVDALKRFNIKLAHGHKMHEYLISVNHLNRKGHALIAEGLHEWFPYRI